MRYATSILLLILSISTLSAKTIESTEKIKSIPVRHWEYDIFNYGVSAGQGTAYLNFSMALRYNFDTPLVDVGGEFTMGTTPHDRYDPQELEKGKPLKRSYFMLSPVAALTPRAGVELFRHFRAGMQLRIPTDGEVTVGPTISLAFGGGKKD